MRRPQWIGALLLALVVAGAFAWLGQWQLGFAIQSDAEGAADSEIVRPIDQVTQPGSPVDDAAGGMVLSATGVLVSGDFTVVEQRMHAGQEGAWVAGHLATPHGHLSVAIGWAPSVAVAERAIGELEARVAVPAIELAVEGRYMPSDALVIPTPSEDPERVTSMVPAQQVNLWQPFEGPAYAGFAVLHPATAGEPLDTSDLAALGLETIESVPPLPAETINWLNLFYAVEWVVFAGFAIFFWYRLARDAWEKEHELKMLAAGEHGAERTAAHTSSPE